MRNRQIFNKMLQDARKCSKWSDSLTGFHCSFELDLVKDSTLCPSYCRIHCADKPERDVTIPVYRYNAMRTMFEWMLSHIK